ncbi:hypothetical protein CHS0354_031182 [Potamilus streckersoni]|uniref:Uncharacterized protein n=1 Tax=Potamilus streckersoni TaxID=2493646 RepID=A0AAE0TKJ7_9BIVA|nr:hypothetical protein CHS0354_031182 [Potamilus streckersoni]
MKSTCDSPLNHSGDNTASLVLRYIYNMRDPTVSLGTDLNLGDVRTFLCRNGFELGRRKNIPMQEWICQLNKLDTED